MSGLLFVVTAPSGAGKSSLIAAVMQDEPQLQLSVSHTTRAPRAGEVDAREYHFVDDATFIAMLGRGEFLESAEVHGHRYGTSQKVVGAALACGAELVLEIDWQGARQVRRLHSECISVFILPPSVAELERRMRTRGLDSAEVIARRLANAREEMLHAPEFDYVIINRDFEDARRDLRAVIRAERLRTPRQLSNEPDVFRQDY